MRKQRSPTSVTPRSSSVPMLMVTFSRMSQSAPTTSRVAPPRYFTDCGAEPGLGHDLAGDLRLAAKPPHVAAAPDFHHVIFDRIARHHRPAELRLVDGEKKHRLRPAGFRARADAQHAPGLGHALDHEHAGKHRLSGKMAEELPLVDGNVLDADRRFVAAHADDAVD